MSEATVIFDNGGGVTLQLGEWAHYYDNPSNAAEDLRAYFDQGSTDSWHGHEQTAAECEPTMEEQRNGGYMVAMYKSWEEVADDKTNYGWANIQQFEAAVAELS